MTKTRTVMMVATTTISAGVVGGLVLLWGFPAGLAGLVALATFLSAGLVSGAWLLAHPSTVPGIALGLMVAALVAMSVSGLGENGNSLYAGGRAGLEACREQQALRSKAPKALAGEVLSQTGTQLETGAPCEALIDFIDDESLFHCRVRCRVRLSCGPSTLYEGRSSCAIDRQPPHGLQLDGIHGGVRFRSEAGSLRVWRSPLSNERPFTVEIRLPSSR